eukprot:11475146-Ditylum_brightwellii.AAC.1
MFQCKISTESTNGGNYFVLNDNTEVYTWFGKDCSAFEKYEVNCAAHSMADSRHGQTHVVQYVGDDNKDFWELLDIKLCPGPTAWPSPTDTNLIYSK